MSEPVGKRYAAILEIKAELPPEGGPPVEPPVDPDAPRPEHPIVIPVPPPDPPVIIWGPDDPRPTHPICLPGMECWQPMPGQTPKGQMALVVPCPVTDPPEAPTLPPAGSVKALVWFGKGTIATVVWIPPYAATLPAKKK